MSIMIYDMQKYYEEEVDKIKHLSAPQRLIHDATIKLGELNAGSAAYQYA